MVISYMIEQITSLIKYIEGLKLEFTYINNLDIQLLCIATRNNVTALCHNWINFEHFIKSLSVIHLIFSFLGPNPKGSGCPSVCPSVCLSVIDSFPGCIFVTNGR